MRIVMLFRYFPVQKAAEAVCTFTLKQFYLFIYLWTSGVNLDTAVRFADFDLILVCKISAIWRRFLYWFLHFICWMSAIFLLPVCLTYWPRKYPTRVDPHFDNSHQVWSWYDHPQPSYSVFVCWYVTWPLTLTFDLLTLNSWRTRGSRDQPCHQVWRPYAYPFLIYEL